MTQTPRIKQIPEEEREQIFEQLAGIRESGAVNMMSFKDVSQMARECEHLELTDFLGEIELERGMTRSKLYTDTLQEFGKWLKHSASKS